MCTLEDRFIRVYVLGGCLKNSLYNKQCIRMLPPCQPVGRSVRPHTGWQVAANLSAKRRTDGPTDMGSSAQLASYKAIELCQLSWQQKK